MLLKRAPTPRMASAQSPVRRIVPCRAAFGLVAHYLQQEVTVEGVLHVSAPQVAACMGGRLGDIDTLPAPALPALQDLLTQQAAATAHSTSTARGSSAAGSTSLTMQEALCMATPPDAPAESETTPRALQSTLNPVAGRASNTGGMASAANRLQPLRAVGPLNNSGMGCQRVQVVEQLLEVEGAAAAYHCTCTHTALRTSQALQASAAVRRQRRRALLRLLREGRSLTAEGMSALASLGSSISSLASWDDDLEGSRAS